MLEYAGLVLGVLSLFVAILTVINAWVLLAVKSAQRVIERLQKKDEELAQGHAELSKELGAVRLLVGEAYLPRREFKEAMKEQTAAILTAIARVEQRVDGKADKK